MSMLKKIPVSNHYAFASVFTHDLEVTREFISALIGKQISRVVIADREKVMEEAFDAKGIRFDVYLKDAKGESFDLELQISDEKSIERRVRYYQSILTADALSKGERYRELKDSYVIFICVGNDPMRLGKTVYEIENTIVSAGNRLFNDGMHSYIFNFSSARESSGNQVIEEIANYFYNDDVTGKLSERIDEIVRELNSNVTWREKVMTLEQEKELAREDGYQQGKAEGIAQGKAEGIAQGKSEGIVQGKTEVALTMLKKGFDVSVIMEITGLSECDIRKLSN